MNDFDDVLIVFSVAVIALVFIQLSINWVLGISLVLVILMFWLFKTSTDKHLRDIRDKEEPMSEIVLAKVNEISKKMEDLRHEFNRSSFSVFQKVLETKNDSSKELDEKYRELARKIFDVEAKINRSGKNTLFALAKLEERLNNVDELLGIFESEKSERRAG